jgi:hypothetical protein
MLPADRPKVIEWNTDFPYSTVKYINGRAMEHLVDRGPRI